MIFGCCVSREALMGPGGDGPGKNCGEARVVSESGFDFVEPGVAWLQALQRGEFLALAEAVEKSGVLVTPPRPFIPRELPIVGRDRDLTRLKEYVKRSLDRVKALGCRYVVFGSGGARQFPAGAPGGAGVARAQGVLPCGRR